MDDDVDPEAMVSAKRKRHLDQLTQASPPLPILLSVVLGPPSSSGIGPPFKSPSRSATSLRSSFRCLFEYVGLEVPPQQTCRPMHVCLVLAVLKFEIYLQKLSCSVLFKRANWRWVRSPRPWAVVHKQQLGR